MNKFYFPRARANVAIVPVGTGKVTGESLVKLGSLQANSMEVSNNDVFTADTFSAEFRSELFPADITAIRCLAIDLHISNEANNKIESNSNTRIFTGHSEKITRKYTVKDSLIKTTGKDYAGLFLENKWQGRSVDLGRSLLEIITEIVKSIPSTEEMKVVDNVGAFVPSEGRSKKRNTYRAQASDNVWEVMQKICALTGLILEVVFDTLHINKPRTILDRKSVPVFVEGMNITTLEISKNLGRQELPNVRVRSWNAATKKTVIGQFPLNPRSTVRVTKSKKKEDVEFTTYVVNIPNATKKQLNDIAKKYYEYASFQQVNVSLETNDMDANGIPLTNVKNGSAIRIRIDTETRNIISKGFPAAKLKRILQEKGYSKSVSNTLSRQVSVVDSLLFVDTATHRFDNKKGYSFGTKALSVLTTGES